MNKEVRRLLRSIQHIEDVDIVMGGKHVKVMRRGTVAAVIPTTPSDNRWHANTVAALRRAGITPKTAPEKAAFSRELIPLEELRARLARMENRKEFVRFMMEDVPLLNGGRKLRNYASMNSAQSVLSSFVHGRTVPSPWAHELLDYSLRAWDRRPVGEPEPTEPEPEPEPPARLITLTVELDRVTELLAAFGVTLSLKEGA